MKKRNPDNYYLFEIFKLGFLNIGSVIFRLLGMILGMAALMVAILAPYLLSEFFDNNWFMCFYLINFIFIVFIVGVDEYDK
jgi:hypothetical protein